MITLYDLKAKTMIGFLREAQLKFLIDQLEEEGVADQDYSITRMTLSYLEEAGGDQELLDLLEQALKGKDEIQIYWKRE